MGNKAIKRGLTQGTDVDGPQPSLTQEPDDAEHKPGLTQGPDDVKPQPSLTQGPDGAQLQSSSTQGTADAESESSPSLRQGDVVYQQGATEEYEPMVPHSSSNHQLPVDEQGRSLNFNIESKQATQIGDTNINTTGPVYNAPVHQHITQHVHQTYENAHCSSQLSGPHDFDEATSPKLPGTSLSSAQRRRFSEYQLSTSTVQPTKHEYVQSSSALMSLLKHRARELASEESSLADLTNRPIPTVNLSIVSKPQQFDKEFQAEGCKEELYKIPQSDITGKEMFARAKEKAKMEWDWKFKLDEIKAKQGYVEKHGNVVGVVGQAGIGKTTSAKKWAMQGLRGELFENTSFFFYIVIRHIDFRRKITLLEFLLSSMSIEHDYTPEQEKNILKAICLDSNVVMIFDGLDEAAFESFSTEVPQPLLHSKSKPENYLKHLAGGNLLPRARKIFTSRPTQLYKLHFSYRPRFIVQILGLTPTSQDELGRQICGDRYDDVQQKLEQNRNVLAYCYVPVNFILVLVYLMNYDGDIQFVSLTRVLAFTCGQYLATNHLRGQEGELDKLAKLAYDAFLKMEIVFKLKAFVKAGIKESTADAFTNTSVTKHGNFKLTILDGQKVRYFSNLQWQEFFAGFYLMMIMSLDEFEKILKQLSDDRWEVVSKFVFGICDSSVFYQLEPLVPESSLKDWKQKKCLLLKFFQSKWKLSSKREILQVCSWAHESNDPEIASTVACLLPDELDLSDTPLLPIDFENLSFVIQHRTKPMKRLDLSFKTIADIEATSLARCIDNIAILQLVGCEIGSEGFLKLCDGLLMSRNPLKILDLSHTNIDKSTASSLARCVSNIEQLILRECGVESEGLQILCDGVIKLTKPLKKLDLSYNKIGISEIAILARCLPNIEEVLLERCEIGDEGVKKLCVGVRKLTKPMKKLDLFRNKISKSCVDLLVRCGRNIEDLLLDKPESVWNKKREINTTEPDYNIQGKQQHITQTVQQTHEQALCFASPSSGEADGLSYSTHATFQGQTQFYKTLQQDTGAQFFVEDYLTDIIERTVISTLNKIVFRNPEMSVNGNLVSPEEGSFTTKYKRGELIAIGSTGSKIYTCKGIDDGQLRIDKELHSFYFDLDDVVQSACLFYGLKHKNVVRYSGYLYDYVENSKYLDTEGNLHETGANDYVTKNIKIDIQKILWGALKGVLYMHEKCFIHRNLKPHNFFISFDGDVMVADSGFCPKLNKSFRSTTDEENFLAPENWNDIYTTKSDVYVLGLFFYYVLTDGLHPFGDKSEQKNNMTKENSPNLQRLKDKNNEHHITVSSLIEAMLQLNPVSRPTMQMIKKHPAFWELGTKLNFLRDVYGFLENESNQTDELRAEMEKYPVRLLKDNDNRTKEFNISKTLLPSSVLSTKKHKVKECKTVQNFLKVIRDKKSHHNLTPEEMDELGRNPQDGWEKFGTAFLEPVPQLLVRLYDVFKDEEIPDRPKYYPAKETTSM